MRLLLEAFPGSTVFISRHLINVQHYIHSKDPDLGFLEKALQLLKEKKISVGSVTGAIYVWYTAKAPVGQLLLSSVGITYNAFQRMLFQSARRSSNISSARRAFVISGKNRKTAVFVGEPFTAEYLFGVLNSGKSMLGICSAGFDKLFPNLLLSQTELTVETMREVLGSPALLADVAEFVGVATPYLTSFHKMLAFKYLLHYCFPDLGGTPVLSDNFLATVTPYLFRSVFLKAFNPDPTFIRSNSHHFRDVVTKSGNIEQFAYMLSIGVEFDEKFGRRLDRLVGSGSEQMRLKFREIRKLFILWRESRKQVEK